MGVCVGACVFVWVFILGLLFDPFLGTVCFWSVPHFGMTTRVWLVIRCVFLGPKSMRLGPQSKDPLCFFIDRPRSMSVRSSSMRD